MTDLKIEQRDIASLTADPDNARARGPRALEAIANSLKRFGQQKPIVVNTDGVVIAGNGTLEAARQLGWTQLAVHVTDLKSSDQRAFAVADNRTSELSFWNEDRLVGTLAALADDDGAMEATGFTDQDLAAMREALAAGDDEDIALDSSGVSFGKTDDEDDAHEDAGGPRVVQAGDVWIIDGKHRLICGSCRTYADMKALMGEGTFTVAVTSPPYASQRKYDEASGFKPIHPNDYLEWWEPVQASVCMWLADDGSFFLNIKEHCDDGQRHLYVKDLTLAMVREWGWRFVDEFVWTHSGTPKAPKQRFKNAWEPIFQFTRDRHKFVPDAVMHPTNEVPDWKGLHPNMEKVQQHGTTEGMARLGVDARGRKGAVHTGNVAKVQGIKGSGQAIANAVAAATTGGMAYPSNVLSIGKNREALGHSAAYPVALPRFFVRAYSDEGDVVFDPFMGSGTTLIAAADEGRVCHGTEISPVYCDVTIRRYIDKFGGDAINEETGVAWSTMVADAEALESPA